MSNPSFYQLDRAEIENAEYILANAQSELELLYKRWEELEA
jgi:BMFP domain-containing protein YqiC